MKQRQSPNEVSQATSSANPDVLTSMLSLLYPHCSAAGAAAGKDPSEMQSVAAVIDIDDNSNDTAKKMLLLQSSKV